MPVASVVIIGNEILSGKFADENGPFMIERLRACGIDLREILVIVDEIPVIAETVRRCAERSDHVFTTGGVGPTHDDLTFEGVAAAFDVALETRDEIVSLMRHYEMPVDEASLRMARLPAGAELIQGERRSYPVVRMRNVWVLPGVPKLMRKKFAVIEPLLISDPMRGFKIFTRDSEVHVALRLAASQREHSRVDIGSYPRFDGEDHRLIVTLEGRDLSALDAARDHLLGWLDVVRVEGF